MAPPRRRPVVAGQKARQRRGAGPQPPTATVEQPTDGLEVGPTPSSGSPAEAEAPRDLPSGAGSLPARTAGTGAGVGLTAALAVLVLLLGALAWFIGLPTQPAERYGEARLDALAAARAASVDLLSVNYETLEVGQKKAAEHLAPKFRAEYTKFFTDLQTTAEKNKLVLTSSVVAGGVTSVRDAHHVVVLLFIDQVSTNAVRSSPRIDQNRVRMRMVEQNGTWLVEGLDAI